MYRTQLTLKGTFDLRSAKRKWITTTYLSSYPKTMASKNLQMCVRRRMTPPPVLIDKIIRDSVMNRGAVIIKKLQSLFYFIISDINCLDILI